MSVLLRWCAAIAMLASASALMGFGRDLIRASHPPFDPIDFAGTMMIGLSFWVLSRLRAPWRAAA
jgi:hypothetical protein